MPHSLLFPVSPKPFSDGDGIITTWQRLALIRDQLRVIASERCQSPGAHTQRRMMVYEQQPVAEQIFEKIRDAAARDVFGQVQHEWLLEEPRRSVGEDLRVEWDRLHQQQARNVFAAMIITFDRLAQSLGGTDASVSCLKYLDDQFAGSEHRQATTAAAWRAQLEVHQYAIDHLIGRGSGGSLGLFVGKLDRSGKVYVFGRLSQGGQAVLDVYFELDQLVRQFGDLAAKVEFWFSATMSRQSSMKILGLDGVKFVQTPGNRASPSDSDAESGRKPNSAFLWRTFKAPSGA